MALTRARQGRFEDEDQTFVEIISARAQISGADHHFTVKSRLLCVDQVLVPQRRFAEAAPILLRAATSVRSSQPQLKPTLEQVLKATLDAWKANDGGPEFEAFQRQARER